MGYVAVDGLSSCLMMRCLRKTDRHCTGRVSHVFITLLEDSRRQFCCSFAQLAFNRFSWVSNRLGLKSHVHAYLLLPAKAKRDRVSPWVPCSSSEASCPQE